MPPRTSSVSGVTSSHNDSCYSDKTAHGAAEGVFMSAIIEANDSNFEAEVIQSEQPVLVDFSATWYTP